MTLGKSAQAGPQKGSNTTRRIELDNGAVGYFKPFGGENKKLESGFGQDSAQQSLHEAAAWRLANQLGPPWSDIVPPVVIRELNGEIGSFAGTARQDHDLLAVGNRGVARGGVLRLSDRSAGPPPRPEDPATRPTALRGR
jgi:hypothetical protein